MKFGCVGIKVYYVLLKHSFVHTGICINFIIISMRKQPLNIPKFKKPFTPNLSRLKGVKRGNTLSFYTVGLRHFLINLLLINN